MENENILVENIDLDLLREQRDFLLEKFEMGANDLMDGLVNMLDDILDKGEVENKIMIEARKQK